MLIRFKKWFTYFVFLFLRILGTFLCLRGNNLFIIWLGFELNMFSIVPLLVKDERKIFVVSKTEIGVGFYYFIVQVFGRILFAWGSILGKARILGTLGLLMKFGFLPFFWWVPAVFSRLNWFWIFVLSVLQKIPSLFVLRYSFDLNSGIVYFICLLTLITRVFGMYKKYYNLKKLIGWSSVRNGVIMILIYNYSFFYLLVFYCLYVIVLGFCCWCFSKIETKKIKRFYSMTKVERSYFLKGVFGLFYFSGLPPFLSFWAKIYFFSVVNLNVTGRLFFRRELKFFSKVFNFPFRGMEWLFSLIVVLIMFIQVIVYLTVFFSFFIQLHSRVYLIRFSNVEVKLVIPFLVNLLIIFIVPVVFWVFL